MQDFDESRRSFLRRTALAGSLALAGCVSGSPSEPSQSSTHSTTVTTAPSTNTRLSTEEPPTDSTTTDSTIGPPDHRSGIQTIPASGVVPLPDWQDISVFSPRTWSQYRSVLPDDLANQLKSVFSVKAARLEVHSKSRVVKSPQQGIYAVEGSFSAEKAISGVKAEQGLTQVDSYRGYTLLAGEGEFTPIGAGIQNGHYLLSTNPAPDVIAQVKALIDTAMGERTPFTDSQPSYDACISYLDTDLYWTWVPHELSPDGVLSSGTSLTVTDTDDIRIRKLYFLDAAVDVDDEEILMEARRRSLAIYDPELNRKENIVLVESVTAPDDYQYYYEDD